MGYKVKFRQGSPRGKVLGEIGGANGFTTKKLALKQAQALADLGYIEDGILVTVEKVGAKKKNPKSGEKATRARIQKDLTAAFLIALKKDSITPAQLEQNKIGWGSQLLDVYISHPGNVGFHASRERYFGGHGASEAGRKWLKSVTDARWDTIIRASSKEAIARHKGKKKKNPSSRSYKGHKIKGKTGKYTVEPYGYEFPTLKAAKGWLDKHVRDAYPKPKTTTKRRKNTRRGKVSLTLTERPPLKPHKFKVGDRVEFKPGRSWLPAFERKYRPDRGDSEPIYTWGEVIKLYPHATQGWNRQGGYEVLFFDPIEGELRWDVAEEDLRKSRKTKKNPRQPTVEIERKGYHRKGYWRTSSKGKRTWVPPTYVAATHFDIKDKGRPGVRSFGAKSAGEGYRRNKRPTKKQIEARRYDKPLITREGKLGGPGYTKRKAADRHRILSKCVKNYGYRSCLGSLQVLLLNSEMGKTARKVILADKKWLEKTYGGPGSFGPRKR